MASRVNVKFVVVLSVCLVAVAGGVALVAYTVIVKSAGDYIRLAEQATDEGEYERARAFYGRAVFRDQTNIGYLKLWRDSMRRVTPDSQVRYQRAYEEYFGALRQLAVVARTDLELYHDFLSEYYERLRRAPFSRGGYADLMNEVDLALANFAGEPGGVGSHETLRRYRALALGRIAAEGAAMTDRERVQFEDDAAAAIAANPEDADVAVMVAQYWALRAEAARLRGDMDVLRERDRQALEAAQAAARAHPNHPGAQAILLNLELARARAEAAANRRVADRLEALRQVGEAFQPRIEALATMMSEQDPARVSPESYRRLALLERITREDGTAPFTSGALSRLSERGANAELLMFLAEQQMLMREYEQALATLERVAQIQTPPVSLQGLLLFTIRPMARLTQGNYAIRWWNESSEDERPAILTRAKGYRAAVGNQLGEDAPALKLLDAKLALAEQDLATGSRLLSEYNRLTGESDAEALFIEAQTAERRGQSGLARTRLQQVIAVQPGNIPARIMLVRVLTTLGDTDGAMAAAEAAREVAPTDERVLAVVEGVQTMTGQRRAEDPVTQVLLEAQRALQGTAVEPGSVLDAIEIMEAGAQALGQDPRLVAQIWNLRMSRNERDLALAAVDRGLAAHPAHANLTRLRSVTTTTDPVQAALDEIAASDAPALERALAYYSVYSQSDRMEEARRALGEARAAGADDPRVVELSFVDAMQRGDAAEVQRSAERAARLNLDQVNGLTYRARAALFENRPEAAVTLLEQAAQALPTNHRTWLLLAQTRRQVGQTSQAIVAYRRALEIRPNDLQVLLGLVRAQAEMGNERAALATAREYERFGRGSAQFNELWMQLEASVGDRAFAIQRRERIADTRPEDVANRIELGRLYTQTGRIDDAQRVLESVRADTGATLTLATAKAEWHATRGDMNGARNVFVDYMIDLDEDMQLAAAHVTYADFLLRRGFWSEGVAILQDGRRYQGPAMGVDRYLGNWASRTGNYALAAEALERVLEAGVDDDRHTVRQMLIECLVRAGEAEKATFQIAALPTAFRQSSVTVRLLEAELARVRGDQARARTLLDAAASDFPGDPRVFMTRAQLLSRNEATMRDAMADLDTAVTLDPANWQALRARGALRSRMGRTDEALEDLRAASRANPGSEELRLTLVVELLRLNREADAFRAASEIVEANPADVDGTLRLADLFSSRSLHGRAASLYQMAWERRRQGRVLQGYVESLLRQSPPAARRALDVIQDANRDFPVAESAGLLMLRGRAELARNREADAVRDFNAAYELVRDNPSALLAFYGGLVQAYPEAAPRVAYLRQLEGRSRTPTWSRLLRARAQLSERSTRGEGLSVIRELVRSGSSSELRRAAAALGGEGLYEAGAYSDAASIWREGLEAFPEDWELMNNLAYTMVRHLSNAAGGLELGERALALAPRSASVHDTVGLAHLTLGNLDDAERVLRAGLRLSGATDMAAAAIRVHLATVLHRKGQREEALALVDQASQVLELNEAARKSYKDELEALRGELASE